MHSRIPPRTTPAPLRRRLAAGAIATVAALGVGALTAPAAQAAGPVTIDLVTINDFHGRIEASPPSGGIAAVATAVQQIRANNPNTIFAAAGDLIGASTFTSFIQQDTPTIETLNAAGLDVSSVGNHEFDKGFDDLVNRVQPLALWEYLGANVFDKATGEPALPSYYVKDIQGVRVGFIGAVTNELPSLVSPAGIADLDIRDVTESVNLAADELTDGVDDGLGPDGIGIDDAGQNLEADVIVLLVHEGAATTAVESATDPASPFGKIVNGASAKIDAIVSGHTHLAYSHQIPFVGGDLPTRPVISSGQYGERYSDMKIVVNSDTKTLMSMDNTIYDMTTPSDFSGAPNYTQDAAIASTVAKAVAFAKVEGAKKVGDVTADFNRGLQPELDKAGMPTGKVVENRGTESTLGNFVADVQLWTAQVNAPSTQIALMNPGGLRANLTYASSGVDDPDGSVTYAEAAGVQPFANTLVTMTLTGEQIRIVLEQQWQPAAASRPFLKLGISRGLTYTADYAAPAGSRVQNLQFDGVAIDPAGSYSVVVNSFLASGGDNFFELANGTNRADSGRVDLEGMVAWFDANKTATPDLAQRSIGVTLTAPSDARGYEVGESIDLDLSSLDFTTSETPAGTVEVSIAGAVVGSAAIDRALVPGNDRAGTATLSVAVPKGVSGPVTLTISTPVGTSFDVPITVFERAQTATFGFANKFFVRKGATVKYTAVVFAKGAYPTGDVTVYDGATVVATATLTAADKGVITVQLQGLSKGVHRLSATYSGNDELKPSTSFKVPLFVW